MSKLIYGTYLGDDSLEELLIEFKKFALCVGSEIDLNFIRTIVDSGEYTTTLRLLIFEIFKNTYLPKIAKNICAISNSIIEPEQIGKIYIGIDDDGRITGIPLKSANIKEIKELMTEYLDINLINSPKFDIKLTKLEINEDLLIPLHEKEKRLENYKDLMYKFNEEHAKYHHLVKKFVLNEKKYNCSIGTYCQSHELRVMCANFILNNLDDYYSKYRLIYRKLRCLEPGIVYFPDEYTRLKIYKFLISDKMIFEQDLLMSDSPLKNEFIHKERSNPNSIICWITKFKDYVVYHHRVNGRPPQPIIQEPKNVYREIFSIMEPLYYEWINSYDVELYLITIDIFKADTEVLYKSDDGCFISCNRRLKPDGTPCCSFITDETEYYFDDFDDFFD